MNSDEDIKIHPLLSRYIDECRFTRRLSESTIRSYEDCISFFLEMTPEVERANDINFFMVNQFLKLLQTRTRIVGVDTKKIGVKPSTIMTYYSRLFTFFSWLETHGYCQEGLTSKLKKPKNPVYDDERALSREEVSRIISAIALRNNDREQLRRRDLLIISILLYTGIRRGELLGLKICDIDFDSNQIYLRAEHSKSKKSRYIPLHPKVTVQLRQYLRFRRENGYVSDNLLISENGRPLTAHGLRHWVKRYVEDSGVSFHLHRFRHTFACTMAKSGADLISIRNMLGHSTTKMTERYLRSISSEHSRSHIESLVY